MWPGAYSSLVDHAEVRELKLEECQETEGGFKSIWESSNTALHSQTVLREGSDANRSIADGLIGWRAAPG